jgi:hypothetical protein
LAKSKDSGLDEIERRDDAHADGDAGATIAERFLLLSLSRDDGIPASSPHLAQDLALAGAILIDLERAHRIRFHHGRVELVDWEPVGQHFLDRALQKIHLTSDPLGIDRWLGLLAEDASDLKHAAFERMAERGLVIVERRELVSGFEAHFFPHVKTAGERSLIGRMARSEPLAPLDVVAVCLADACDLFEAIVSEKRLRRLAERIRQLADINTVGEPVTEAVHAASRAGRKDAKRTAAAIARQDGESESTANWEWRAFWSDRRPVITPGDALGLDGSVEFKATNVSDRYLLIPERRDNIKLRKNGLEVKEIIESYRHYDAFRPKQVLKFPIAARDMARIFPRLFGATENVANEDELEATLSAHGYVPSRVDVEKVRNRVRLVDDVRLEFCEFTVGKGTYWSACVEGPDIGRVRACVHTINPQAGRVMGYMDFLHRVISEQ